MQRELVVIDDLVDEFDLLDDWEQRYRYLIDMGKALIATGYIPPAAEAQ